jgi:hypothetical protein
MVAKDGRGGRAKEKKEKKNRNQLMGRIRGSRRNTDGRFWMASIGKLRVLISFAFLWFCGLTPRSGFVGAQNNPSRASS